MSTKWTQCAADAEGIVRWSFVSPYGINPGADGILRGLEDLGNEGS